MSRYKAKKKKTPKEELKQDVKKVNWKLWLVTLLSVAAIFALYQVCVYFCLEFILPVYAVLLCVLCVVYMILNKGLGKGLKYEELPENWDEEKKQSYLAERQRCQKHSKPLLIPIIGIMITLCFDIIYLFYLDPIL